MHVAPQVINNPALLAVFTPSVPPIATIRSDVVRDNAVSVHGRPLEPPGAARMVALPLRRQAIPEPAVMF